MTEEVIGEETWLSQEAFDRLSKELETLQGPGRADIAEKIDSAREEGDLKENGGYHAAREGRARSRPASASWSTSCGTRRSAMRVRI